jgi:hypothetical protein
LQENRIRAAAVVSCSRPGRTSEVHNGHPSGAEPSRRELLVHLTDADRAMLQQHAAAELIEARMTEGMDAAQRAALRAALSAG